MSEEKESSRLLKLFIDISRGYSLGEYKGQEVYLKHFNLADQAAISEEYERVFNRAKKMGLPTEKERLDILKKDGFWGDEDELEIINSNRKIKDYKKRMSKTIIKAQKEELSEKIKKAREVLNEVEQKKLKMLHDTCESYSASKSSSNTVWMSMFLDKELTQNFYTKEAFEDLERSELNDFVGFFNNLSSSVSVDDIKKLAILPSFTSYFYLIEGNLADFFSKKLLDLTFHQTSLLSYGKMFKNIFENYSGIPEGIMRDPDAILDFAETQRNENQKGEGRKGVSTEEGAYSRMGASSEDMVDSGVSSSEAKDLHAIAKEKGGELTWRDFATSS